MMRQIALISELVDDEHLNLEKIDNHCKKLAASVAQAHSTLPGQGMDAANRAAP
jgi:hypothetical protein